MSQIAFTVTTTRNNKGELEVHIPVANDRQVGNLVNGKSVTFKTDLVSGTVASYMRGQIILQPYGPSRESIHAQLLRFMDPASADKAMIVQDGTGNGVSFTLPEKTRLAATKKVRNGASGTSVISSFAAMHNDHLVALHSQKGKIAPKRTPGGLNTYKLILPGFARNATRRPASVTV